MHFRVFRGKKSESIRVICGFLYFVHFRGWRFVFVYRIANADIHGIGIANPDERGNIRVYPCYPWFHFFS